MTIEQLMEIADSGYPDNAVLRSHHGDDVGDTLADFIATEISETFDENADDEAQIDEAIRVISRASDEVYNVLSALERWEPKPEQKEVANVE